MQRLDPIDMPFFGYN